MLIGRLQLETVMLVSDERRVLSLPDKMFGRKRDEFPAFRALHSCQDGISALSPVRRSGFL